MPANASSTTSIAFKTVAPMWRSTSNSGRELNASSCTRPSRAPHQKDAERQKREVRGPHADPIRQPTDREAVATYEQHEVVREKREYSRHDPGEATFAGRHAREHEADRRRDQRHQR